MFNRNIWTKPASISFRPQNTPRDVTWDRTRAALVERPAFIVITKLFRVLKNCKNIAVANSHFTNVCDSSMQTGGLQFSRNAAIE